MKVTFSQPVLLKDMIVNHAYIKLKENKKHTHNRFRILDSSSFLIFQPKIFYSILFDIQAFPMSGYLLNSNKSGLRWKKYNRKLFFFFLSLCLTKVSIFSPLFSAKDVFTLMSNQMIIFQRLVI